MNCFITEELNYGYGAMVYLYLLENYEDWSFDLGLEQIWMLINPCLIIKRVKESGNDQEGNTFKGNTIEGKAGW